MRRILVLAILASAIFLFVSCSSESDSANTCIIILHPNNGDADIVFHGKKGETVTLPEPIKAGQQFLYWLEEGNNICLSPGNQFAFSEEKTIEINAIWEVVVNLPDEYEDIYGWSNLSITIPEIDSDDYCPFWVDDNGERLYPDTMIDSLDNINLHLVEHVFDEGIEYENCVLGHKHYTCSVCGWIKVVEIPASPDAHSWVYKGGVSPTHTDDGTAEYTCAECGQVKTEVLPAHINEHVYSTSWSYDSEYHWHEAICGHDVKSDLAVHSFSEVQAILNDDGITYSIGQACYCGYIKYSDSAIGAKGPAGGCVFYDKGEYSDGWRYLEAAPGDLRIVGGVLTVDRNSSEYWYSGESEFLLGLYRESDNGNNLYVNGTSSYNSVNCTRTDVGTGMNNTKLLVNVMGTEAYSENSGSGKTSDYAARMCDNLTHTFKDVTYDDWYLPSKDELDLIYENILTNEQSHFPDLRYGPHYYGSSSEAKCGYFWARDFNTKYPSSTGYEFWGGGYLSIRPVRSF